MKKTIFLLFMTVLAAFSGVSQATFYTNDQETTSGKCGIQNLKVEIDLPDEATSYDKVDVAIQYLIPAYDNDMASTYQYSVELSSQAVSRGSATLVVKGDNGSAFRYRRTNSEFDLEEYCNSEWRWDEKMTLAIHIKGKTFLKTAWDNDGNAYPTYTYTSLATYKDDFTMDFGMVSPVIKSEEKLFAVKRYHIKDVRLVTEGYNVPDEINYHFDANDDLSKSIYFEAKGYESGSYSTSELKTNVTKILLRQTNPEQSGFDTPDDIELGSQATSGDYYYIPELVVKANGFIKGNEALDELSGTFDMGAPQKAAPKKQGDRNKLIAKMQKELGWKKQKVGDMDAEVLEVNFYRASQVDRQSDKSLKLKNSEKGSQSKLYVMIGESKGRSIIAFISQRGYTGDFTALQKQFVADMMNGFTVL